MNIFVNFYKYDSPNIPGPLIKNFIYKILWRLNMVQSPSMGKYRTYVEIKKNWNS